MKASLKVSVILCTHNPQVQLLDLTFTGLSNQTLARDEWELLIIDNASTEHLAEPSPRYNLGNSRVIREPKLGLTPARLCGINCSKSELLVFVDDDAVLDKEYLYHAVKISEEYPFLGAFGGSIELDFFSSPPEWTKPHWPKLAQRHVTKELWANFASHPSTTPWGVGMCVRRQVAMLYEQRTSTDSVRIGLDRSGTSLVSGGDDDLARTSHELGLATGIFPQLKLIHNIPSHRLTEKYLLDLTEAQSYSGTILKWLYGEPVTIRKTNRLRSLLGKLKRYITHSRQARLFLDAHFRGQAKAVTEIEVFQQHADK